ncbi:MAG: BlaI/MecI/CopY family transcriptional regulator [Chitinophagaceae bacterium]
MEKLTGAEEEIMLILWDIKKGFVKDIRAKMKNPKPHYNTIATIIKILCDKGFVNYTAYGKTYEYFPVIAKDRFFSTRIKSVLQKYCNNSASQLVSFFVQDKKISIKELEELVHTLKNK